MTCKCVTIKHEDLNSNAICCVRGTENNEQWIKIEQDIVLSISSSQIVVYKIAKCTPTFTGDHFFFFSVCWYERHKSYSCRCLYHQVKYRLYGTYFIRANPRIINGSHSNSEPRDYPGNTGTSQKYTLDGTTVHQRAPYHCQSTIQAGTQAQD